MYEHTYIGLYSGKAKKEGKQKMSEILRTRGTKISCLADKRKRTTS